MTSYIAPLVYAPARWSVAVTVDPADEPVTLAEVKEHLREDGTDQDTLIADMAVAAREVVEGMTRRALMTQTRVMKIDRFPDARHQVIELPGGNIQSVTSIAYIDEDGATQTWGTSNYVTDLGTRHGTGRVGLAADADWPGTADVGLAVTVTYIAGWTSASAVPTSLRHAIKMIARHLYDARAAYGVEEAAKNPAITALVGPWRILKVA